MRGMIVALVAAVAMCLLAPLAAAGGAKTGEEPKKAGAADTTDASGSGAIEVKTIEPFTYCAVEMTGAYDQHAAAFQTLYAEAAKQGISPAEAPFGIYWSDPDSTAAEDLEWEIGFAVPEGQKVAEPLKKKKWEYDIVVSTIYEGSFAEENMMEVYGAVYTWIDEHGYIPAGPAMERYPTMPLPDGEGGLTGTIEIMVPIQEEEE